MNISSDIRVAAHQERLHNDLVRKHAEVSLLVDVRGDPRRRQIRVRPAVDGVEYLCGVELLPAVVDPVEDLPENLLVSVLHNRGRYRNARETTRNLLDVRGKIRPVRVVSQPRQRQSIFSFSVLSLSISCLTLFRSLDRKSVV